MVKYADVVELVDTTDLKSVSHQRVSVRLRPSVPFYIDNVHNSKYNLSRNRLVLCYWADSCVYLYRA